MVKYNFKIAFRNILKNPGYSSINILGLTVGISMSFMILLYLLFETSYDQFYSNHDKIFRLGIQYDIGGKIDNYANAPRPLGPTLKDEFPEVQAFVRLRGAGSLVAHRAYLKYKDRSIESEQIFIADSSFFTVFQQPVVQGNPKNALANPGSIVLSESLAFKLFGSDPAVGKRLEMGNRGEPLEVTAVFEDLPDNTHMPYEALVSWNGYYPPGANNSWVGRHVYTYVLLNDSNDPLVINDKFTRFFDKYMAETFSQIGGTATIFFQPLKDIHLTSNLTWEAYPNGNTITLYLFGSVALFLLVIAIINYVNLTTARSVTRAKEIGIRKSVGAQKNILVTQFLSESIIVSLLAFLIAIILCLLITPFFGELLDLPLFDQFLSWQNIFLLGVLSITVGLISGAYPSFFIAAYGAVEVLKGKFSLSKRGLRLRKILVIIQLATSIFVIIGTLIVLDQVDYIKNKDLGFNKENVLVVHLKDTATQRNATAIKTEIRNLPTIEDVALAFALPDQELNHTIAFVEGSNGGYDQSGVQFLPIEPDILDVLNMEVIDGRNFHSNSEADRVNSIMINEAAAQKYNWNPSPVGKRLHFGEDREGNIDIINVIGVIKDFHMGSLQFNVEPVIIYFEDVHETGAEWLMIKIQNDQLAESLQSIRSLISGYNPQIPVEYKFLDENFVALYQKEQKLVQMMSYLSLIIIAISCLGLLGLISFTVAQRAKEVAIRKVLGAQSVSLVMLISKDFLLLSIVANLIAWPFAFWVMNSWLESFAYRIDLGINQFLMASMISLVLVSLTITHHALKIAEAQPLKSLRND